MGTGPAAVKEAAQAQVCPKCRLLNPPTAVTCDCGYNFTTALGGGGKRRFWRPDTDRNAVKAVNTGGAVFLILPTIAVLFAASTQSSLGQVLSGAGILFSLGLSLLLTRSVAAAAGLMVLVLLHALWKYPQEVLSWLTLAYSGQLAANMASAAAATGAVIGGTACNVLVLLVAVRAWYGARHLSGRKPRPTSATQSLARRQPW